MHTTAIVRESWAVSFNRARLTSIFILADTDKDPYSVRKGLLYSHFGWMLMKQSKSSNAYQFIEADAGRPETNRPHCKRILSAFQSLPAVKANSGFQNMSCSILQM